MTKGGADFTALSFLLFGMHVSSLYKTWFVLLGASIAVFVACFWRWPPRLALAAVASLAAYSVFFVLPLTSELATIQNPRAFGIVSIVAVLHLSLLIIDGRALGWGSAAATVAQAALIVFSVHVRSTEVWQVLCLLGVAMCAGRDRALKRRLARGWPVLVLALGMLALEAYQLGTFDSAYRSTQIRHRIMWHNIGIGFALNPVLAAKYSLVVVDAPMIRLVRRRLRRTDRATEVGAVFKPPGSDRRHYGIARDYVRYEAVAREVVFSIVQKKKWQALATFIFYKPLVLGKELAWAAGCGRYSLQTLHNEGQAGAIASDEVRRSRGLYLNPFRLDVWVALLAVVAVGTWRGAQFLVAADVALASWIAAASLIPNLVAYPNISSIGVGLVTVTFAAYALAVGLLAKAVVAVRR